MKSIYPIISSARYIELKDYTIERFNSGNPFCNIHFISKCFFVEVDIYIPRDLKFIPISVKNKDGLACFVYGYIKNIVLNHADYIEL